MTEPVSPLPPAQPVQQPSLNIPVAAKDLQSGVDNLTDQLQKLHQDGSLSQDPQFQSAIAHTVEQVSRVVGEIQRSLGG